MKGLFKQERKKKKQKDNFIITLKKTALNVAIMFAAIFTEN